MVKLQNIFNLILRTSSSVLRGGVVLLTANLKCALEFARSPRSQRGQALIETALVLPIMFVFMLVIVDFGLALDHREVIQHDVREGARRGAVGATEAEIKAAAGNSAAFPVEVCYVDKNGNGIPGNAGDSVRVSGTYVYEFTIGGGEALSMFGINGGVWDITMNPSAESRLETSIPGATACP